MNVQTNIFFWRLLPTYTIYSSATSSIEFSAQWKSHFSIDNGKGEMEEILPSIERHRICEMPKQNPTINKMELGSKMIALKLWRFLFRFANRRQLRSIWQIERKLQRPPEEKSSFFQMLSCLGNFFHFDTFTSTRFDVYGNWNTKLNCTFVVAMRCKSFRIGFWQLCCSECTETTVRVEDVRRQ